MGLQKQVNIQMGTAVAGDFASQNPRKTLVVGRKQLRVGANGTIIARFAEADPTTGLTSNAVTGTKPVGFVSRASNIAYVTGWLDEASMLIPKGKEVTLHSTGDFYVQLTEPTTYDHYVFASNTDGAIKTDAGDTMAGYYNTGFRVSVGAAANDLTVISK